MHGVLESHVLHDADVVFAAQKLRMLNPGVEVLAELVSPGAMPFLSPIKPVQGLGQVALYTLPAYTSGQVGGLQCAV
jgi:hypothetical protein